MTELVLKFSVLTCILLSSGFELLLHLSKYYCIMNKKHEGISCDFCHKSGFSLRRYKCLLCFDYDLCGPCFDFKRESNNHHNDHPMQCLLTKYDYGTFYAGEIQTDLAFSYTCPICGQLGHTILTLKEHLNQEHNNSNLEVICPICASLSDGNANEQTKNLAYHLSTKHNSLISGESQEYSPKVTRRFTKQTRTTTEATNSLQTTGNRSRKTIQPNTTSEAPVNPNSSSTVQSFSTSNFFTGHDQSAYGNSEEPLLHTLLNHLYTWRTRQENISSTAKTNFGSSEIKALSNASSDNNAIINESIINQVPSLRRGTSQINETTNSSSQGGNSLSRSATIKSAFHDRNKSLRRKLGSRHIIDLTGDNWRLIDPDNDLFSFDDDDLESISLSLNQASLQPGDIDDSEYMDDDEDITSLIPWGQDIGPESIFSQLKTLTDPKTSISSSNNSFVKNNGGTTMSSYSNNCPNNLVNMALNIVPGSDSFDFKLPPNIQLPSSCEFFPDSEKNLISVNLDEHLGPQGLFSRDIHMRNQQNAEEQNSILAQRSHFIRDLVLSTFITNPTGDKFDKMCDTTTSPKAVVVDKDILEKNKE